MSNENGIRRVVWVPNDLDRMIEETRKKIGLNRSAFFKYAVNRLLEELSVLSTTVHAEETTRGKTALLKEAEP